jgi:hypothetical protein
MSHPTPSSPAHARHPRPAGHTPTLCPSSFQGRNGFTKPIRQRPSNPSEVQSPAIFARCRLHRPTSETERPPPIPIVGGRLRSRRLFRASRERVLPCLMLGAPTREKALFLMSSGAKRRPPTAPPRPGPRPTPFVRTTLRGVIQPSGSWIWLRMLATSTPGVFQACRFCEIKNSGWLQRINRKSGVSPVLVLSPHHDESMTYNKSASKIRLKYCIQTPWGLF